MRNQSFWGSPKGRRMLGTNTYNSIMNFGLLSYLLVNDTLENLAFNNLIIFKKIREDSNGR